MRPRTTARAMIPELLVRLGFRVTGPRRAVLDVLAGATAPLSAAQIHAGLGRRRANLVSVYRAVRLLAHLGVLRLADTSNGTQRFELSEEFTGHHHHLVCRGCGRIEDVDGCLLAHDVLVAVNRRMLRAKRFRVTGHDLRLFGLCARCAGPRSRPSPAHTTAAPVGRMHHSASAGERRPLTTP